MPQALAYSYVRFSSEKQAQGQSLERQLKLAKDYADKNGLTLDDHSYRDLGVSAFRGKNAAEGALAAFIEAVDSGNIKPGSYLLVESLDRLSRDDVDVALEMFLSINRKGITIVTLGDNGAAYSKESIKKDRGMSIMFSILVMIRANEESATKSQRVRAAWAAKAEKGDILTKVCPGWIRLVDGKFELIEERAEVVRRMFELYSREGRGSPFIAKLLNEEGIKPFGWAEYWTNGTVASILSNPATYGTLRRKKAEKPSIPNYYPAAVSEQTFLSANAAAASRQWKGGRKGEGVANLFAGMSYCGECGSKMRIVSTHGLKAYLKCTRAVNSRTCTATTVPLATAEPAILYSFLKPQKIHLWSHFNGPVFDKFAPMRMELLENNAKIVSLIKLAELTGNVDHVAKRINELEVENTKLKKQIKQTPAEKTFSKEEMESFRDLYEQMRAGEVSKDEMTKLRSRLQSALRRMMTGVIFFPDQMKIRIFYETGAVRRLKYETEERYRVNGTFAKRPLRTDDEEGEVWVSSDGAVALED